MNRHTGPKDKMKIRYW